MCTSETSFSLLLNFKYTNKNGLSSKKLHFAFSIVVALTRMYFLCIEGGIPVKTVAIAVGAGVLGAGATIALAPVVLAAVGFTGTGVAAGSLAASLMSSMGPIAAGSTFATLQSAGATGVIGATAPTVAGVVTGAAGGIGAHLWSGKKRGTAIMATDLEDRTPEQEGKRRSIRKRQVILKESLVCRKEEAMRWRRRKKRKENTPKNTKMRKKRKQIENEKYVDFTETACFQEEYKLSRCIDNVTVLKNKN